MQKVLKIWILMMSVVTLLLTACIDDDLPEDNGTDATVNGEEPTGDVFIRFSLRLGDGVTSRAEGTTPETPTTPDPPETVGDDNENVINTVDILVFDVADNRLCDAVYLNATQVEALKSEEAVTVPVMGAKGKTLHIYAAVNIPPQMRSQFVQGQPFNDLSYASAGGDYWNVMNEFVPGSNGKQEKLGSSGIPMTGQFKITGVHPDNVDPCNITITGEHSKRENPLEVKAELSRMVAKVHLLAWAISYKASGKKPVDYVYAADNSPMAIPRETNQDMPVFDNWIGWMPLDSVRYIINGINKSTYLFPQTDEAGKAKDRNMDLADYRKGNSFDELLYGKDFTFYDALSLHKANISNTEYFGRAEKYEDDRLDHTGTGLGASDRYKKGLYCPENYFTRSAQADEEFYSNLKNGIPIVTHLSIATKLVPRDLVVLTDFPALLDQRFKDFENDSIQFYKSYEIDNGITREDFWKAGINLGEDAKRWKGTDTEPGMREYYFGKKEDPNKNGVAQVKRKDFYLFSARNIEEANCFVNWSLIFRGLWSGDADNMNLDNSKWPKNTYYVYDTKYGGRTSSVLEGDGWNRKYVYLVAGAVDLATGDNISVKQYSVPHVGGWGYYYTYIDNCKATKENVTPYWASQVTRNTYYIITVNNFGSPGGTITDPEYIKVNTDPVNWDYVGKGEIELF